MHPVIEPLLVAVLLLNFAVLGTSRMRAVINGSAVQGALLGAIAFFAQTGGGVRALLVVGAALLLKGIVIPWMLRRAMRDVVVRREVAPLVGYVPSLLAGAVGTVAAIVFARTLPLAPQHQGSLLVPAALATVFTGFLLLTTRRKAITQAVGYLVLENGVFVMGLCLIESMPFLVEMGVLLDLLVGVFVMGIIIGHIQRELESLDTTRLSKLKE
jgi:hydrogenase-4 component E